MSVELLPIASVTAVLKSLLENELVRRTVSASIGSDVVVSSLPPDRISVGADERTQLNLFFYQATPNTRLQSRGPEAQNGTPQFRPLSLDLHYLVTAYGAQDLHTEVLISHTLRVFHETPLLAGESLEKMLTALAPDNGGGGATTLAAADVAERLEEVTIRPQFLSTEEMSRLWSALQARFRPSMAYKVTVVMNDE